MDGEWSAIERVDAADLAPWVRQRAGASRRFLMGLAGPPGCGKSTVAAQLSAELDAPVAPMDGYHLPNTVLDERGWREVKGAPHTFDVDAFVSMLQSLRSGADVWLPDFDRTIDDPRPERHHIAGAAPIVIVEGNYLLLADPPWHRVADLLDAVGYIDVDDDVRVRRLIDRHIEFGKSPDDARAFVHESDERNAALVVAARARADVAVVAG